MEPINPDDYEPSHGVLSHNDGLVGNYCFFNSRLVTVLLLGGLNHVVVADAISGKVVGYPTVNLLVKAVRKEANVEQSTNEPAPIATPNMSPYDKFVQENPLFPEDFTASKYQAREQLEAYNSALSLAKLIQDKMLHGKCQVCCDSSEGSGVPEFSDRALKIVTDALNKRGFFTTYMYGADNFAYLHVDIVAFAGVVSRQ
jgi:hypothetical protein